MILKQNDNNYDTNITSFTFYAKLYATKSLKKLFATFEKSAIVIIYPL